MIERYTGDPQIIQKLGTNPEERGLTTAEFKAKFDQFAEEFVQWFNQTHCGEVDGIDDDLQSHKAESVSDDAHGLDWQDYVQLTLTNGWSGTLRARKNSMGLVWLYGEVTPGATTQGTAITQVPEEYRPNYVTAIPCQSSNPPIGGIVGIALTTAGNLNIYGSASTTISTSNVRFNHIYKVP